MSLPLIMIITVDDVNTEGAREQRSCGQPPFSTEGAHKEWTALDVL